MRLPSLDDLARAIQAGHRPSLARAITLCESFKREHRAFARALLEKLDQAPQKPTLRVGLSGVPGAGKSCLCEALGLKLLREGHRVAVLAVDPSSPVSGGSVLGDKIRMDALSQSPDAFIRPSPSSGVLGGVARNTRECIRFCESAGFDVTLIETVGVGQSEDAVSSLVDCLLLVLVPGQGDELQGIKRGLLERADVVAVNKADGEGRARAEAACAVFAQALQMSGRGDVPIHCCSALESHGLDEIWNEINRIAVKERAARRIEQAVAFARDLARQSLLDAFEHSPQLLVCRGELEAQVRAGQLSPYAASEAMLARFLEGLKNSNLAEIIKD